MGHLHTTQVPRVKLRAKIEARLSKKSEKFEDVWESGMIQSCWPFQFFEASGATLTIYFIQLIFGGLALPQIVSRKTIRSQSSSSRSLSTTHFTFPVP